MDEQKVAHLFHDVGTNGEPGFIRRYGLAELDVQAGCESTRLHLARNDPAAGLVNQRAEHATMHGVYPPLIVCPLHGLIIFFIIYYLNETTTLERRNIGAGRGNHGAFMSKMQYLLKHCDVSAIAYSILLQI